MQAFTLKANTHSVAQEALQRTVRAAGKEMMKVDEKYTPEVVVVKKQSPKVIEVEEAGNDSPMTPQLPEQSSPLMGIYDFFNMNPFLTSGENKKKIEEIHRYFSGPSVKTNGDMFKKLGQLCAKMGTKDIYQADIDRVHRHVKIKLSIEDLKKKASVME